MRLDLRFTYRPPEGLYCQAIVIFSFNIHDGLSRVLKNIDKRMAGSISSMINNGFWSGEFGEKLLFATQEALNADKLLLYGMGAEPEYSLGVLKKGVSLLGASLVRLGTSDFVIYLPVSERFEAGYLMHLETAIKTLANIFLKKYKDDPEFTLKMHVSVDMGLMESIRPLAGSLREFYSPFSDITVVLDTHTWLTDPDPGQDAVGILI